MSDPGERRRTVLEGYAKFLHNKELALPKHQPYLVRWVKDFLGFATNHAGYTFEQTLDLYLAEVGRRVGIKPWQVQQGADAVRISLLGIAVENGTVLVTFFHQLRGEGLCTLEAVKKGCELRFRPLLMTALTTLFGLTPMIYATGSGSEIQRPLATVVMGGLASALFLTLVVLPALYCIVESKDAIAAENGSE